MKRIVVTGATSMIGTALIEECIRHDIEVYAVVRAGSSKTKRLPESARIHQIECELEKLEELPAKITGECDTFFHIAWGNTGENRNSSTELQSRNVFYTLKAVRAAHAMGCKRFIGAGSQAEYGPMDVPRIAPDSPVHPTTPYGASKLAANQLSFMLCKELGMEWIWPRIFSVYGIYEKETTMIASGLRKMLKGSQEAVQTAVPRIAVMQTIRRALRPLMATALSHRQATAVHLMAVHQQALQSLRLQAISFMMSVQLWHSRQSIMGLRLCLER